MPHDRRLATLILAVTAALTSAPALSADPVMPFVVAQDAPPPPPPAEGPPPETKNEQKAREREQRREQPPPAEQDPQRIQEMQQRQQERLQKQQQQQQERAQQRQQEMQRRLEERQQQQKARQEQIEQQQKVRQEQIQEQQRQLKAKQNEERERLDRARQEQIEQLKQQREAERAKAQEEKTRQQQDAERARQQQDQERQQREAERAKAQEEKSRQQQYAERARQQQETERRQQERARQEQTAPPPAGATTPARDDDRRRLDRDAPRDRDANRNRDDGLPAVVPPPPAGQAADTAPQRDRRRIRAKEIRESYRQAPPQQRSFDDLRRNRRERTVGAGNLRIIEEPDRRVIVKQNNRTFIRSDDAERFRRISPDARTIRRADGTSTTFMTRSGGIRIYDVTDRHGRLIYRYRRYPDGREVVLIDNRRYYKRDRTRSRDVLIGAGLGLLVGSAIALAEPQVRIPRDRYIVDYGRASDDDLYEALSAPPIERLDRGYSLEEIRYSRYLRDRMRRIDLDTVTFDFGSWEVGPDQSRALDRLADGINRVLARTPDEIFMIEGHTDAVGSEEDNLTLSDRRAQSVAEILTVDYGVPPENLVTQGYGEEQLKIPTERPERLNRRITVRRIGPLLSGRFDGDRSSVPPDDRYGEGYDDGRYDERQ